MRSLRIFAIALIVTTAVCGRAQAAAATAEAGIDWSSLSIMTTGDLTYDFFELADFVSATANFSFDTNLPGGTPSAAGAAASATDGVAAASASADPIGAAMGALSAYADTAEASPHPFDTAFGEAFRLFFLAPTSGSGTITVTADYKLEVSFSAEAGPFATADAIASIGEFIGLTPEATVLTNQSTEELFLNNVLGMDTMVATGSTLSFTTDLLTGGDPAIGVFLGTRASVRNTPTVIPIPATLLLIAPAAAGLLLGARRQAGA